MTNFKEISKQGLSKLNKAVSSLCVVLIRLYQMTFSPFLGGRCRFDPSCSQYGIEAFQKHSPVKALTLTVKRISKCHPLGSYGYDPVPEKHHD